MLEISLLLIKTFLKFDDKMYIIFKICFLEFWKEINIFELSFKVKIL